MPFAGTMTKSRGVRLVEIAEILGVSKQRAHQIADEDGFPAPMAEDVRGRLWDRREVAAWAKRWPRETLALTRWTPASIARTGDGRLGRAGPAP
jgi:predicted DNA-binding transcriptional regulator AlpA